MNTGSNVLNRKSVNYADFGDDWCTETEVGRNGVPTTSTQEELVVAAGMMTAKRLKELNRNVVLLADQLFQLRRELAERYLSKDPPGPTLAEREKASRDNAMAAWLKAGGGKSATDTAATGDLLAKSTLSTRCKKAFRRMGITTVVELCEKTADDLLEERNFGASSLEEVRQYLEERGLKLAD